MTDDNTWENVARATLAYSLLGIVADLEVAADAVTDTVYWGHDISPEQVELLRQSIYDLQYATEEYLASICEGTEPWGDEEDRQPSWNRGERGGQGSNSDAG